MATLLISNATIINRDKQFSGNVLVVGNRIEEVSSNPININPDVFIDASGLLLFPGVIDDQVHFRTPGLTHKGDIESESKAAVAGGITSFMDMPNVVPPTTTLENLQQKMEIAQEQSWANYSFYFGATNENLDQIKKINPRMVCGVKIFMGSSTGNMLVDNEKALSGIFAESPVLVAVHCEDEATIIENTRQAVAKFGDQIPINQHPVIRSAEACFKSSSKAVELAQKYNSRLHVLHISTEKELSLFSNKESIENKRITAEVCVHHLWFSDVDYEQKGNYIKWNPAIKSHTDRYWLREAVRENIIDIVATDHAPHTMSEKQNPYLKCPSGGPMIQHSLVLMLELVRQGVFTYNQVVEKMCHAPAKLFKIIKRGYIEPGYYADIVLVDPKSTHKVTTQNILYKCGWSPLLGDTFSHQVVNTIINGNVVFDQGLFQKHPVSPLEYNL
jgi:dihydroorotase